MTELSVSNHDNGDNNDNGVVDGVLQTILHHILTDTACEMHRSIKKTGNLLRKEQETKHRWDLYSHDAAEEMDATLQRYATEEPMKQLRKKRKLRMWTEDSKDHLSRNSSNNNNTNNNNNSSTATETQITPVLTRHQKNETDIWGRIPPKEPKTLAHCRICDRDVCAIRFASHLDKCMNLGTARGSSSIATAEGAAD
mmetsp:Transcript_15142/g.23071  ORF Transcript_15142/g.23071 Transcript_15142/m.23071 type:complete len:197 (+) Transcript_15142:91-681(+)